MNSRSGSSSVPNLDNKSQGQNVISPPPPTQPPTIAQQQQHQQAQLSNHQQQYPGKTVHKQYQTNGQSLSIPTLNKSTPHHQSEHHQHPPQHWFNQPAMDPQHLTSIIMPEHYHYKKGQYNDLHDKTNITSSSAASVAAKPATTSTIPKSFPPPDYNQLHHYRQPPQYVSGGWVQHP